MSNSDPFELKNGNIFLTIEAPGGIYNSSQLETIMRLMEAEGAIVKTTEDQRLALLIAPDSMERVAAELMAQGLHTRHYNKGLHQPVSCIGELCPYSKQDALGTALSLTEKLQGMDSAEPLRIGLNGCERSCVPSHSLDISLVGDEGGYKVFLGGKSSLIPEFASYSAEGLPADLVTDKIAQIVEFVKQNAGDGESFHDLLERVGMQKIGEILAPYSQDALPSSDISTPSQEMEHTMDSPAPTPSDSNDEEVIRDELFDDIQPEAALAEETLKQDTDFVTEIPDEILESEEMQIPEPPPVILTDESEPDVDIDFKEIQNLAEITLEDSQDSLSTHQEESVDVVELAEEPLPMGETELIEPEVENLNITDLEIEEAHNIPPPPPPLPKLSGKASKGVKISGVNLEDGGFLKLDLETGMSMRIQLSEVPAEGYEINLGGQSFRLNRSGDSILISLGLLELSIPI